MFWSAFSGSFAGVIALIVVMLVYDHLKSWWREWRERAKLAKYVIRRGGRR